MSKMQKQVTQEQLRLERTDTLRLYMALLKDGASKRRAFVAADLLGLAVRGMFDPAEGAARLVDAGFSVQSAVIICAAYTSANEHSQLMAEASAEHANRS
jgi:hypothetical protein